MDPEAEMDASPPDCAKMMPEEMEDHMNGAVLHQQNPGNSKNTQVLLDQERYLPIANVVRLMKMQMDPQAKLAKDAKECVQECVSEFISFIASEAAEICNQTKRKTITADDLLTALEATGFDNYAEPMRIFLMKYRQAHKVTGPIHRHHPNYQRPKQFEQDQPLRPLFFDTDQGRRCTETQYVVNGSEVIKNAPLSEEWNEHTGQLNRLVDDPYAPAHPVNTNYEYQKEEHLMEPEEDDPQDTLGAIALEQQGQMQIYVDPKSKQHYAAKETPNGMELYPLIIQDTPLQLENVTDHSHFVLSLSDGTTGHALIPDSSNAHRKGDFHPKPILIPYGHDDAAEEVEEEQIHEEIEEEHPVARPPPRRAATRRTGTAPSSAIKRTPPKRRK